MSLAAEAALEDLEQELFRWLKQSLKHPESLR